MGPGASFDPVWGLMAMFGVFELLVIALLVMPMPSNALRGNIQGAISKLWHEQEYVRKTSWVLLTLNSYYFYDATRNLLDANKIHAASCDSQLMALYFQRNVLVTGGSVFLHFVMKRLLDIQGQLFAMRQLAKEAAAAQQQLLGGSSSGGASGPDTPLLEAHRALSLKLIRLARSSADGGEEERANKQQ